ncbi:MAG: BACON domain-containing protein [Bacteroidales bacterium]|nr:BACON domain-containing protein [Bacteroidales bacterium]
MKINSLLAVAALCLSAAVSCDSGKESVPESLTVSPLAVTVNPDGGTHKFTVKSNYDWTASCDSWITLSSYSETASEATVTVAMTVGKNSDGEARTGVVSISLPSGRTEKITVMQEPFSAPKGIYNATDIADIAAALNEDEPDLSKWTDDGKILLYNDVDATSLDCFPLQVLPAGVELDGQGHSVTLAISSSDAKVGMFRMLRGSVRNLNLLGSVTVSGELGSETHIGSLAADAQGATLENVHNYVSVSVDVKNTSKVCVIPGGLIGKASNGLTMTGCSNNSDHSFKSVSAATGAYHMIGGLVGAYGGTSDEGICAISDCKNLGNITCDGGDQKEWNYAGGIISNVQNMLQTGDVYSYTLKDCEVSGDIVIAGVAKTRAGGVTGRVNACNRISGCSYSGTISLNAAALERNVGGIGSFQEKTCSGLVSDCVFSGRIVSEQGHTGKYFTGGIISSGCAASTVIENCRTTKDSYISNYLFGNIGMIISQGGSALTVRNCRIAGTMNKAGEEIVLSAANYKAEYVGGMAAGSKTVVDSSCGYNAE